MGSLSNLYISQSYQSLIHFGNDSSASTTLVELQDGVGNGLGVSLNTLGELKATTSISSSTIEATNLVIKNKIELTGSIDVDGPVTASNVFIENDLIVSGTLFANKVVTLIESSSIIFSSGSNILGDSILDIQTLNGTIIMSGSSSLTGSMGITGDLNVLGNISSSTLSGMGNVNQFVTSIQASTSSLNLYTASAENKFTAIQASTSSLNNYTASADNKFLAIQASTASLNAFTASQQPSFNALNAFTASQLSVNSNLNAFTASTTISLNNINAFTASIGAGVALLTGSQSFVGNQTITGSLILSSSASTELTVIGNSIYTGSVRGNLNTLSVVSTTASFDCNLGNFFTLNLPASVATNINPININPGQTISLRIIQNATPGTVTYPLSIKFPSGSLYTATQISGAVDILTFISYDTNTLFATRVKNMI